MSAIEDFRRFVADAESGTQYAKWAQQNPGELTRWQGFRDALLAGQTPTPPAMTSAHGRDLIDGGRRISRRLRPSADGLDATSGVRLIQDQNALREVN